MQGIAQMVTLKGGISNLSLTLQLKLHRYVVYSYISSISFRFVIPRFPIVKVYPSPQSDKQTEQI